MPIPYRNDVVVNICVDTTKPISIASVNDYVNVKAAPWDATNFRFYFRTEVVYPTDHVFIFFRILIFL